jgi:hypothetical protein
LLSHSQRRCGAHDRLLLSSHPNCVKMPALILRNNESRAVGQRKGIPSQSAAETFHDRGFRGHSDDDDEDKRRKTHRSRDNDFGL